MKFYEIIRSNNWLTVEVTFVKLYPDQQKSIEDYRLVYEALKFLQPVYLDIKIVLYQYYDDAGHPSAVDVSGINPNPEPEDINNGLALEFTSWDKWLGMDIDPLTLKEFTEIEIICHCLNEMTYAGFDEEEIQNEFSKLQSIVDEYKTMTAEEKAKHTIGLDELRKKISDKKKSSGST
jgi:hypothetical protein